MPNLNKANRQVCDVDIRDLATMKPYLFFDTANTTTQNVSSESVYAMAKGSKRIGFQNPLEGTCTIEAQIVPFKFYAMMAGGEIESEAVYAEKKTITAEMSGSLNLVGAFPGAEIIHGTVFVYEEGHFGEDEFAVVGTFDSGNFTGSSGAIVSGQSYEVGVIIRRTSGVAKISVSNKNAPKAYYVTFNTVEKNEYDVLTPFKIVIYKAQVNTNFELSQSSEGDPASITMTFEILEDSNRNFMDMIEITDED